MIKDFDRDLNAIPSWKELDYYTSELARRPSPPTIIMVEQIPPDENMGESFRGVWNELQEYTEFLKSWPETDIPELSMFPPFLSVDGSSSFYRESADRWDLKMRSIALNAIWAKQQGYRVRIAYFILPLFLI